MERVRKSRELERTVKDEELTGTGQGRVIV